MTTTLPCASAKALRLDVTRLVEILLDEALAATERRDGLARRRLEELGNLVARPRHLEAATAAAERRLDRHRQPVRVDELEHLVGVRDGVEGSGCERSSDLLGDVPGRHLVAEALDRVGARTDPGQTGTDDRACEIGVLRQEAVARVNGVGSRAPRHGEQLVDDEVGLGARRAVEAVGLIRETGVQRIPVLVGIDGDRGDAAVPGRTNDSDGDLAPIGDEDLADTGHDSISLCGRVPFDLGGRTQERSRSASETHKPQARFHSCVHSTPSWRTRSRSVESDSPITVLGSPSTERMKAPPRLSTVNAPATSRGSPVAT